MNGATITDVTARDGHRIDTAMNCPDTWVVGGAGQDGGQWSLRITPAR